MFDFTLFTQFFVDLAKSIAPLAFLVVLTRIAFRAIIRACGGRNDIL